MFGYTLSNKMIVDIFSCIVILPYCLENVLKVYYLDFFFYLWIYFMDNKECNWNYKEFKAILEGSFWWGCLCLGLGLLGSAGAWDGSSCFSNLKSRTVFSKCRVRRESYNTEGKDVYRDRSCSPQDVEEEKRRRHVVRTCESRRQHQIRGGFLREDDQMVSQMLAGYCPL